LLLIEDGVYAATVPAAPTAGARPRRPAPTLKVYALAARHGRPWLVTAKALDGVTLVDYAGFVDLDGAEHSTSHIPHLVQCSTLCGT
jgi:sulfur transfer complex TusBCD TusB component (DsrH family)